jgi:hypothetical protein
MVNTQGIFEKRRELKEYIYANMTSSLMALLLRFPSYMLRKVAGYSGDLSISLSLIFIGVLVTIPTILAVLIFQEMPVLDPWGWLGIFVVLEGFCVSPVIAHFNVNRLLRRIGSHVVDSITSVSDLSDLKQCLSLGWTPKIQRQYLLCWVVLLMPIAMINLYIVYGEFQPVSLYVWVITFLILSGISWSYAPLNMLLSVRLSRYEYELHEIDPAHSETIGRIASCLNSYAYGYAINAAIVQLVFASVGKFYLFGISADLIAWIPLLVQFSLNQTSMRRIIVKAKWRTLRGIQAQLKELHYGDIKDKNNIEAILRLMDYHERIRTTPNSVLDLRALFNLSNQLAIPTLGFLVANYNKLI